MKQLHLQGVARFAEAPIDAPDDVVTTCKSEAAAVRWCIDFASQCYGINQRTIAKLCGWDRPSFLSEIANDNNEKRMPAKRIRKFTLATGCRLLEQYHERQQTIRDMTGKATERDRSQVAVAQLVAAARAQNPAIDRRAAA